MTATSQINFLRNLWYYAMPSDRLKPKQTVTKFLLNEPILFGRDRQGKAFAIQDACPHRAVPLSDGRFNGEEIECCYHGWRFNPQGQCTAIPCLTEEQTLDISRFSVKSYPLSESQGNIWIYMSDKKNTVPQLPAPTIPLFSEGRYQMKTTMLFPCEYDQAVVGLMDPAHVPFVHRAWWWRADPTLSEEIKAFDPSFYGFTMRRHKLEKTTLMYDLAGKDPEVEISFQLPGIRIEQLLTQQNKICNLTVITPLTAAETEVTTMFYTTLPWLKWFKPILIPLTRTFLDQDRQMVIKQKTRLPYNPPMMLIKDADTQARWYFRLKKEFQESQTAMRPFVNPVKEAVLRWRS
ncbi:2Fe-2S ferredoxin [Picosynechococcus sp. PCC 7003]|uniref:aromatic ring-hydroxylating oxygenase subunit alpha n=1 Tax=Picosynechococcus sp. PCC 7003 TaxID=374981 RepID=UPI000810B4EA|nr:aromatic ring-hydroxylating dioxygenase subunit alpha [Picosynechococcus sp. PCC 7003]ANV82924.1 2Fe-2S ferredoxin [Picosynechococcus sp. PCC 7003]